jgi:non-heme chloroperoxidase
MDIILINIAISVVIFFTIALSLIVINGKSKKIATTEDGLKFDELAIDYSNMKPLQTYICRDNTKLNYHHYQSQSETILILLHGSGWHSQYLFRIANYISSENISNVYTPDLRGHGKTPIRRGDIDYINQLEDDLADFIDMIKRKHPNSKIILGGHSSGGGLAIRFAGSKYNNEIDGYILLSPFLKYNAPTMRKESGGWAFARMPRIVGLSMLNGMRITLLNNLKVIDFNMPKDYRDGTETLSYSYRLNEGYAPRNYKKDLAKMNQKLLVVVGESDESFIAEKFSTEISSYKADAEVVLLKNTTHMGVVVGNQIGEVLSKWFTEFNESH